ncbi:RNA polymerase sigma factor [Peristeroidobacter soli]|jgi:RNA polymerase sigma-70 factor (ECF subfamily)|uniref:RNA polymerase sigma factor n=1 Tax=Peristeroidobacter soli TaxID=2497877 RepID=UPI00101C293B|nr:sigma-70 family RNA polymerase sigma factor [Peristeroidobacter soli]
MRHLPRYFSRLQRLLLRRGRTHAESEDLIQEAFLRMQEYCEKGGDVRRPEGFLVRTVLRLAANARRDAHPELYCEEAVESFTDILDTRPLPEEMLAAEECLKRMRDALDAVNPRTREIFFMQRLDGLSYAQIARQMGISISAVEKHMASALAVLSGVNELP